MKILTAALVVSLAGAAVMWTSKHASEPSASPAPLASGLLTSAHSGTVVSIREVTLKAGVDPGDFERFVAEEFTPTFEQYVPGVGAFILKGIRGDRTGGYAFVLTFDAKNTRDFYFPSEHGGEASVQGTALELWRPGQQVILDRLMNYVDGISETEGYTDYVAVAPGAQPAIHTGHVVAVREVALKAEVDPTAFERFALEELTSTFDQHVPGVHAFIMKGDRGDRKGDYLFLLVFDAVDTRNFYFPTEESTEFNMPEAALALWRPGQRVLLDRLLGYVVALGGGATEEPTGGFTDYVVLG